MFTLSKNHQSLHFVWIRYKVSDVCYRVEWWIFCFEWKALEVNLRNCPCLFMARSLPEWLDFDIYWGLNASSLFFKVHLGQDNVFCSFFTYPFCTFFMALPICSFCVVTSLHQISPYLGKFHLDAPLILRILRSSEILFPYYWRRLYCNPNKTQICNI